jgi:hypothetical protein
MEEVRWQARAGFLSVAGRALWYEFFCDAVSMPIEVFLGRPSRLESTNFTRVLRVPFECDGAPIYFSTVDADDLRSDRSFRIPSGRYNLFAIAVNPGVALETVDVPADFIRFEHHLFYFAPLQ